MPDFIRELITPKVWKDRVGVAAVVFFVIGVLARHGMELCKSLLSMPEEMRKLKTESEGGGADVAPTDHASGADVATDTPTTDDDTEGDS